MLSTKDLKLKLPNKKLTPRFLGPLTIREPVGEQAYKLWLPTHMRIHDTINVSRLEKFTPRADCDPPDIPVIIDNEQEWEVEEILDKAMSGRQLWYGIKWKGWDESHNSWQPASNLRHADEAIASYERKKAAEKTSRKPARRRARRN
jgi:hypothetical protein